MNRPTLEQRFWPKCLWVGECLEWMGAFTANGTPQIRGEGGGKSRRLAAYAVAWALGGGRPLAPGEVIARDCRNKRCVRFTHLRVFESERLRASWEVLGRGPEAFARGAQSNKGVLTERMVVKARRMAAGGASHRDIARALGIKCESTVGHAVSGYTWKHLPGAVRFERTGRPREGQWRRAVT